MVPKNQPTGSTGGQAIEAGPRRPPGDVAVKPAAGIPAVASVAAFGGNRGGKPRQDGLVPGSPEADRADKEKDAKRKRDARAAEKLAEPAALPSMDPNGSNSTAPALNGSSSLPGAAPAVQSDFVPWDAGTLQPLLDEFIDGSEKSRIEKRRARAAAVGLPETIVKECTTTAVYPGSAKRALSRCGANGVAKAMNSLGVSGKYSDIAIATTALLAIFVSNRRSDAKFEELIAEFKNAQGPKANVKP